MQGRPLIIQYMGEHEKITPFFRFAQANMKKDVCKIKIRK